jgi:hypothetical protein
MTQGQDLAMAWIPVLSDGNSREPSFHVHLLPSQGSNLLVIELLDIRANTW